MQPTGNSESGFTRLHSNSDNGSKSSSSSSLQRRLVSLGHILSKDYVYRRGDYIEVYVVHSFFFFKKQRATEFHFILSDREQHISAILYGNIGTTEGENVPQVYMQLKEGTINRINHFDVILACRCPFSKFILRDQRKRLKLRNSAYDTERISESIQIPFLKHVPFQFTKLDQIDKQLHNKKLIDLLAVVKNIEDKVSSSDGSLGKLLQLIKTQMLDSTTVTTDKFVNVAMFGHRANESLRIGSLYAFSNIFVKNDPMYGLSLCTTVSSVIIEVSEENIMKILPSLHYHADLITYLTNGGNLDGFGGTLKHGQLQSDTAWADDEDDELLSRSFSQLTKMVPESSAPPILPLKTTQDTHVAPPPSRQPLATTHVQSSLAPKHGFNAESPLKRTLPTMLPSNPSPLKKLRHSPTLKEDEKYIQIKNPIPFAELLQTPQQFYDCINQFQPLNVIVTPSSEYKDTSRKAYSMRSKIRGMALIINNFFPGTSQERQGSYFDVMYLTEYLVKCNFDVTTKRDIMSFEFKSVIQEFKQKVYAVGAEKFDALFIAILSHGVLGSVQMADEVYIPLYDDIVHQFDEVNFPFLEGKPKIVLVQACQNLPSATDVQLHRNVITPPESTKLKNMIICHGTIPGSKAYRDIYLGSYFVYVLVDILMKNSHKYDFEEMLKMVQEALDKVKWEGSAELACAWSAFQFRKMYFNPGL